MAIPKSVMGILKYEQELLFIVRRNELAVFPGYCSFPGGKVDAKDLGELENALRREIWEELALDITDGALVEQTCLIGEALTPDFNPYQFKAYYFLIELKKRPSLSACEKEVKSLFWADEEAFRKRFETGELIVIAPIWKIINLISDQEKLRLIGMGKLEIENFDVKYPNDRVPCIESIFGVKQFMPLSRTLFPATRTNCFLIDGILVDPSPRDATELKKLLLGLSCESVRCIFITHHHPDHLQYAHAIAQHYSCDVFMSGFTYKMIQAKNVEDRFEQVKVKTISEGEQLGVWNEKPVRVYEIPGHDQGHLGLAPDDMSWFIVGDLFQGIGTVVIGGEEGDMTLYLESLKRIIGLAPRAIIPSHGIALGGTAFLESIYRHRLEREDQVMRAYVECGSVEGVLNKVYQDLPSQLQKYAMITIESHLKRLKQLGRL